MDHELEIKKIISDNLGIPINLLSGNSDLVEDLNAQDLEISDLITKLEARFLINLSAYEKKSIKTVADIIDLFTNE